MTTGEGLSVEAYAGARGLALLRLAVMLTGTASDAEDLLQTTYERLLRNWDKVATASQPHAYARRVMVNEFLQWKRSPSQRESPVEHLPEPTAYEESTAGTDDDGWRLLATLPKQQRATLALRYYEDLPDERIAEILGCSHATVRSNASRGLATLRDTHRTPRQDLDKEAGR